MSWREERRKDQAAAAEQARADAIAAAEADAIRTRTQVQAHQAVSEQRERQRRQDAAERRAAREAARDTARQRRHAVLVGARVWASARVVDLLIYPLAVVSALMAVPAMAAYGREVYGNATGYALFCITELGMWAFALAVQVTRRRFPDRPVWALQVGVWTFTAVAFVVNFGHGNQGNPDLATDGGPLAGLVMGVASTAGVVAHQLVTAAPRRSRTERDAARVARREGRKLARVRRAAVRAAVAEIDTDGTARLLFTPGCYELRRGRRLRTPSDLPVNVREAGEDGARAESTSDTTVNGAGNGTVNGAAEATAAPARRKPARSARRKSGRKLLADYVTDARASWSPGVEITPAWARRATGCSSGLSSKVARALREEITATHPDITPATDATEITAAGGRDSHEDGREAA
jgi:hypothetical protein